MLSDYKKENSNNISFKADYISQLLKDFQFDEMLYISKTCFFLQMYFISRDKLQQDEIINHLFFRNIFHNNN